MVGYWFDKDIQPAFFIIRWNSSEFQPFELHSLVEKEEEEEDMQGNEDRNYYDTGE